MLSFSWFEKHLNWTVAIIAITAWLVGYAILGLTLLITGLNHVYLQNSSWTFDVQVVVYIANAISILCFGWILKQKKRSLWFLLLFVPPFIPVPIFTFTIIALIPFWLVGVILLLLLRNNSDKTITKDGSLI